MLSDAADGVGRTGLPLPSGAFHEITKGRALGLKAPFVPFRGMAVVGVALLHEHRRQEDELGAAQHDAQDPQPSNAEPEGPWVGAPFQAHGLRMVGRVRGKARQSGFDGLAVAFGEVRKLTLEPGVGPEFVGHRSQQAAVAWPGTDPARQVVLPVQGKPTELLFVDAAEELVDDVIVGHATHL